MKSWVPELWRFWFFFSSKHCLQRNVTLPSIALRYYRDSVTVILTVASLETHIISRAVMERIVTQSRRLVEVTVSKWLNWPSLTFLPRSFKQLVMGKPTRSTNQRQTIVNSWERCLENNQMVINSGFSTVNPRKWQKVSLFIHIFNIFTIFSLENAQYFSLLLFHFIK